MCKKPVSSVTGKALCTDRLDALRSAIFEFFNLKDDIFVWSHLIPSAKRCCDVCFPYIPTLVDRLASLKPIRFPSCSALTECPSCAVCIKGWGMVPSRNSLSRSHAHSHAKPRPHLMGKLRPVTTACQGTCAQHVRVTDNCRFFPILCTIGLW